MGWCEQNRIEHVFGLARNERLENKIAPTFQEARLASRVSGSKAIINRMEKLQAIVSLRAGAHSQVVLRTPS